MAEPQSYSFDNVKLMVAGIVLVAVCFTVIGMIPVGILILGLIISIKGGDVKNIKATTRLIQGLILLGALGLAVYGIAENYEANAAHNRMGVRPYDDPFYVDVRDLNYVDAMRLSETQALWSRYRAADDDYAKAETTFRQHANLRDGLWVGAVAVAFSALLLGYLWLGPLERRFERMRQAAADFANRERKEKKTPPPSIYNREAMTSYSTAEELRKWRDLFTDGAITR